MPCDVSILRDNSRSYAIEILNNIQLCNLALFGTTQIDKNSVQKWHNFWLNFRNEQSSQIIENWHNAYTYTATSRPAFTEDRSITKFSANWHILRETSASSLEKKNYIKIDILSTFLVMILLRSALLSEIHKNNQNQNQRQGRDYTVKYAANRTWRKLKKYLSYIHCSSCIGSLASAAPETSSSPPAENLCAWNAQAYSWRSCHWLPPLVGQKIGHMFEVDNQSQHKRISIPTTTKRKRCNLLYGQTQHGRNQWRS